MPYTLGFPGDVLLGRTVSERQRRRAVDDVLCNDRSFLFELAVSDDGTPQELRPVPEIRNCAVHPADGTVARWCRDAMRQRSREFGTEFERDGEALVVEC